MWFPPKKEPETVTGGSDEPWLTRDFIEIFKSWDTKNWRMFEWGTGSSTFWFASRVKHLISMDHNPYWHNFMKDILKKATITNVELYLATLASINYYDTILKYEPFDCVLVDGRNRVRCVGSALKRVKPGGVIILDNADRAETNYSGNYKVAFELLKGFREYYKTTNGRWRTDYWIL